MTIQYRAIELTKFMKTYIPTGWDEPLGDGVNAHKFMWYDIEAIEAFYFMKLRQLSFNKSLETDGPKDGHRSA